MTQAPQEMEKTTLKTSIAHLPGRFQQDLKAITELMLKHSPRPEMIILFGSFARGEQVEATTKVNGTTFEYTSDYDILVVTERVIDELEDRWLALKAKIDKRPTPIPTSLLTHDIHFLNEKLEDNHYFFVDLIKEGIMLYDSGKHELTTPGELTPKKQLEKAQDYLAYWMKKGDDCKIGFDLFLDRQIYAKAAFELHQAVESYYAAFSLVMTDYKPKTHDLDELRKRGILINGALKDIFPLDTKEKKRLFTLLRKAYVEARYNQDYKITAEELQYLSERVMELMELVKQLCEAEIARLQKQLEA
ncbi:MAG: HEPN domain-containing protein [Bacteroidota bacterium]